MKSPRTSWAAQPSHFHLTHDDIAIWRAPLDPGDSIIAQCASTLSSDEKLRAAQFHFDRDRHRFIAARAILRALLAKYLHQFPATLVFHYGAQGKPELSELHSAPSFAFSVSHSQGLAVYVFAWQRNLGIDIEQMDSAFPGEEIAKRFFSPAEREALLALPPELRDQAFYLGWTRKEAYLKAQGQGLQTDLDSFDVALAPDRPAAFLRGVSPQWQISSFWVDENCPGALVYDGPATAHIHFFSATEQFLAAEFAV